MGAVPLSVPAARSGGPPTDTGSALRAASAAESGTGLGQRAASAVEAGRAADLTVWASSLRPRKPSGSSSASTWRSRECWTCSPRVSLRFAPCRPRGRRALSVGVASGCRCSQGVPLPRSSCRPAWQSRSSLGLPCRSPLASRLASPIAFSPQSGEAAGRRTRLENLVRRGLEMESEVRGGAVHAGRGQRALETCPESCKPCIPPRTFSVWGAIVGGACSTARRVLSPYLVCWRPLFFCQSASFSACFWLIFLSTRAFPKFWALLFC